MSDRILKIHPTDNVWVALTDLHAGEKIINSSKEIVVRQAIPAKHKFSETTIEPGESIRMYGVTVGQAVESIPAGFAITTRNIRHNASSFERRSGNFEWTPPSIERWSNVTFNGYHREDGQVGVANYWLVIPLVFCENRNVSMVRAALEEALGYGKNDAYKTFAKDLATEYLRAGVESLASLSLGHDGPSVTNRLFPNVDGIKFLTHEGGCGGTRHDADSLCALLAGYIRHPNVAGATVLSLGCQNAEERILQEKLNHIAPRYNRPLIILEQQKEGTEQELLEQAIRRTFIAMADANKVGRKPAPLSKLVVGLKCGGSDGFSGISANPAIGHTADLINALGGSTVLCEFPELCGVEQNLIDRCVDDARADKFIHLMKNYAKAAAAAGSGFDMNPSPGNIKDGLITDAMKSAGAARKGGTGPVTDVLEYAEPVTQPGLNLLCTPGNDVESTTGMAGSGASIILFTTGLGTPTGNPVAPVIKISSNTNLAKRMPDVIDFDAGGIIKGEQTVEEAGGAILDLIVNVANGQPTKTTLLRQDDFIPWKRGVSL